MAHHEYSIFSRWLRSAYGISRPSVVCYQTDLRTRTEPRNHGRTHMCRAQKQYLTTGCNLERQLIETVSLKLAQLIDDFQWPWIFYCFAVFCFLFHATYTGNTMWTLECAIGLTVGGTLQVTVVTVYRFTVTVTILHCFSIMGHEPDIEYEWMNERSSESNTYRELYFHL